MTVVLVVPALDLLRLADELAARAISRIDLGSGPTPIEGFWGFDRCTEPRVSFVDLASGKPWPLADESVEELYSSHFIEHVPAGEVYAYEFVAGGGLISGELAHSVVPSRRVRYLGLRDALCWVMDEAYRVAKPGARFRVRWPALVDERTGVLGRIAFVDPTHRRFIPREQMHYFSRAGRKAFGVEQYGCSCDWVVVSEAQADLGIGCEYDVMLQKPERS
jgi:hypothetical protein